MTTTPSEVVDEARVAAAQLRRRVDVRRDALEVDRSAVTGSRSGRRRCPGSGRSRTRRRPSTRKIAGPTRSRVSPTRPSGMRLTMPALNAGSSSSIATWGVSTKVGMIALTRMPCLRPLGRPLAGQRADGALGRHVRRVAGIDAEVRADRRDVEDGAATALLDHLPDDGLGRHDRAPDVQLHDPVPVGAGIVLGGMEGLAGAAADGVDQEVDAAEALDASPGPSARVGFGWSRRP